MIIGLPESSVMLLCEAGMSSLCTLGSNFMYGRCSWYCSIGSSECLLLRLEIIAEQHCLSLLSNLFDFVTVFEMLKLSMFVGCDVRKMSIVFCRKP